MEAVTKINSKKKGRTAMMRLKAELKRVLSKPMSKRQEEIMRRINLAKRGDQIKELKKKIKVLGDEIIELNRKLEKKMQDVLEKPRADVRKCRKVMENSEEKIKLKKKERDDLKWKLDSLEDDIRIEKM